MPSQFGGVPFEDTQVSTGSRFGGIPLNDNSPQQEGMIDTFIHGAEAPFKPIINNTLESLKNTATQTGEAMNEPMNNPSVADWSQHPIMGPMDAAMRALGKAGNAVGGTTSALLSPVTGALSASVEPALPGIEKGIAAVAGGDANQITAEQNHNLAMNVGGDLTNAVMLGKTGIQGDLARNPQYGPTPPQQSRAGFMGSNSSDPNAAPIPKAYQPDEIKPVAQQYYQSSEAKGGTLAQQHWDNTVDSAIAKSGAQTAKGQTMAGENFVTDAQKALTSTKGSQTSLAEINEIDDDLRDRIGQAYRAGADRQATKLIAMRDTIREASTNAPQSAMTNPNGFSDWQTGDKLWSAYRQGKDIQSMIENADKADVPSTAIKNSFKTFVKNDKNLIGLTDDEISAAQNAAKTGIVTAALKTMGSKLIAGVAGGAGGAVGGGVPGALVGAATGEALGYPMRVAASAIQRGKGQKVIDMIGQRPEVQAAMPSSTIAPQQPVLNSPLPTIPTASSQAMERFKPLSQSQPQAIPPQSSLPNVQSFAQAESSNNPNAKNPNSSASGLYQFTNKTWNDMVMKYGKQTGITIGDKNNPQAQATMAKMYAKDNIPILQQALGRDPTIPELYAAHVLGGHGAAKLLSAPPNQEAIMLFPRQVFDANRNIFFNGKTPRTVGEVRNILEQKVSA